MNEIWVLDTSSILEVRRRIPKEKQDGVFSDLTKLVKSDTLVFPIQVFKELERFSLSNANAKSKDLPFEWTKLNKERATRHNIDYQKLRIILQHPQVSKIVDPDKIGGEEEADPYVLCLAYQLLETHGITVLTEEVKDRPDKISMNTACGLLRLVPLRMMAFLGQQGIWA